jgi:hypothetical protein
LFSCDVYERYHATQWEHVRKHTRKYEPGEPPANAHRTVIDGMHFYTLHVMTESEIEEHCANLRRLLARP